MAWSGGVYTRGYPSWSNDAANNLPISSTKFDTEDNDFAAGLNNCLTKDGLTSPSSTLNWSQTAAPVFNLTRGSDGSIFSAGRSGGTNNPVLQIVGADATGISLNLTTSQTLSLAIAGTNALALSATQITLVVPGGSGGLTLSSAGNWNFAASSGNTPTVSITGNASQANGALFITGGQNQFCSVMVANATSGQSYGVWIKAGTTSGDYGLLVSNQGNTYNLLFVAGDGHGTLGYNGSTATIQFAASGAVTISTPGSAVIALTLNAAAGDQALQINGASGAGNSYGIIINAGTNSSDYGFLIKNQAGTSSFLQIFGDGEALVFQAPAATQQGSPLWQIGYVDTPLNAQTGASYQLVFTDRGKLVQGGNGHIYTIPANSSVAFPVGTTIVIANNGGGAISIAITTDTLTWLPSAGSGTRTLANNSVATLYKVAATTWWIWGFGLT